jgi:hypothetical protein
LSFILAAVGMYFGSLLTGGISPPRIIEHPLEVRA